MVKGKVRLRLFHVEDSVAMRNRIGQEITRLPGVEVVGFAESAEDAIAGIHREEPDVVVLDLRLERSSGIEVLRALQRAPRPPTIIVLTNNCDATSRELSLRAGASYFFDKSTEIDEFLAALNVMH